MLYRLTNPAIAAIISSPYTTLMATAKSFLHKIQTIDGFLRDDEALLLYQLAKNTPGSEAIVEIGSWKGKSTICLALGSKQNNNSIVYAIDPHTGSPEHQRKSQKVNTFAQFQKNIQKVGLKDLVKPLKMTSHLATQKINQPIKLLFIDGNHSYQHVKQDFLDWSPKLKAGGIIAFHDTISWPGPKKLVLKQLYHSKNYKNIKLLGSITYAQKTPSASVLDLLKNRYALLLRHLRNLANLLPLSPTLRLLAKQIFQKIQ